MTEGNRSLVPQPGMLYMVATPIGNLADISERAAAILRSVDLIACEDTRTTRVLLRHIGAQRDLIAYHDHNEKRVATELADRLEAGSSIAVVSDAGTPGLSDPGFRVVRECRRRGLPVVSVPGPSALLALLSSAGLPTNAFSYFGFLPPKKAARRSFLEKHIEFPHTIALYESCHRIAAFVDEIAEILGPGRVIAVGKELTKLHETVFVGTSDVVRERLANVPLKGEFVLLIAPPDFAL
jgi:16S rRNA (cytidine1402-2'-O)-methyltransferase